MSRQHAASERKGRAGRTAFVLGLLVTIAGVASIGALGAISELTKGTDASELEQFVDGTASSAVDVGGWSLEFPNEPSRGTEGLSFPVYAVGNVRVDATRWRSESDGDTTFDALVFDVQPAVAQNPTLLEGILASLATGYGAQRSDVETPGDPALAYKDAKFVYDEGTGEDRTRRTALVRVLHDDNTVIVLRVTTSFPGGRPSLFGRFVSTLEPSGEPGV